jgi:DNA-3-methyladenine glycosylase I
MPVAGRGARRHELSDALIRCAWADGSDLMRAYHDAEWGTPLHDDRALFELLCLEGAQAGLSWRTVLNKRQAYRDAFHRFDIARVAAMDDGAVTALLADPGLIRNRQKLFSVRDNARAAMAVIGEDGSLDAYLWSFTEGRPIVNGWTETSQVPARTALSDRMSKDLKKRRFNFVGSTICYAFMQATGIVNDHLVGCFKHSAQGPARD